MTLNQKATYANELPLPANFMQKQPKPYSAVSDIINSLQSEQFKAGKLLAKRAYCDCEEKLKRLQAPIEMMEDYSYTNIAEDKATLGENIFNPYIYYEFLDPKAPIRRKMLFLLGRLYEKHPVVVKYYATFANRPTKPVFDCD